jgi:hypothetical protein
VEQLERSDALGVPLAVDHHLLHGVLALPDGLHVLVDLLAGLLRVGDLGQPGLHHRRVAAAVAGLGLEQVA